MSQAHRPKLLGGLVLLSWLIWPPLLWFGLPILGKAITAYSMLPVIFTGWVFGSRQGVAAAAGVILIALVANAVGDQPINYMFGLGDLVGWAMLFVAGWFGGFANKLFDRASVADQERSKAFEQADRVAAAGSLAASIAHELNNPLAIVAANMSYLGERLNEDAESVEVIAETQEAVQHAAAILRRFAGFVRGQHEGDVETNLKDVVDAAMLLVRNDLQYRAALTVNVPSDCFVEADQTRLVQVLVNVIINAGQSLAETKGHIEISAELHDDAVVISVADNGCGIAAEDQERVFEPFFTTKKDEGTGIGLFIGRQMVRAMEGELTLESTVGEGTTVFIELPRVIPAAELVSVSSSVSREGIRILIIDDEEAVVRSIARALGKRHDVVCAHSGEEALALLRTDRDFDVVLCDVMMPRLNGQEVHRRLAARHPALAARFAFLTGGALTEELRNFLSETNRPVFSKPLEMGRLEQFLKQHQTQAAA